MPDAMINQDLTVTAYFEDQDGPISSANVSVEVRNARTDQVMIASTPASDGQAAGYYDYTISKTYLTQPVRIKAIFSGTKGSTDLYQEVFVSVGIVRPGMITKREARLRIAEIMSGHDGAWELIATSGTTTSAVVPELAVGGTGEYRGFWAIFQNGTNRGLVRRVTAWDKATNTLSWGVALPVAVASGDRIDMIQVRPAVIDRSISDALSSLRNTVLSEIEEQRFKTDGTTIDWQLPSDAVYVSAVGIVRDSDGILLGWLAPHEWSVEPGGLLRVTGDFSTFTPMGWIETRALPSGYTLKVKMLVPPPAPIYDDSLIDASPAYVVNQAAAILLSQGDKSETDLQRSNFLSQRAELERRRMATPLPADATEVRW
jgi:hypothetical protein